MWKSLRDGFRYRKRVGIKGHTGDSGDEQIDIEKVDDWPYSDVMSFLIPTSTKYPRKTTSMGSSETINITENSNDLPADYETKSNYSYVGSCKNINNLVIIFNNFVFNFLQTSKNRKRDIVAESVAGISTAIGKLVDVAQAQAKASEVITTMSHVRYSPVASQSDSSQSAVVVVNTSNAHVAIYQLVLKVDKSFKQCSFCEMKCD